MATYGPEPLKKTFKAAGDLSTKQYTAVKLSAAETVTTCGAGEAGVGILTNKPAAAGRPASVWVGVGYAKLKVDGSGTAISAGDYLKSDANGLGVKTTTDNEVIIARALEASSASGDIIEVETRPAYRY